MCHIVVKKSAKVSRRTAAAITGYNQVVLDPDGDLLWHETAEGKNAASAKTLVYLLLTALAVGLWGPVLFNQTHDVGVVILVPALAFAIGNGLTYFVFGGETLMSFVASIAFGVAAAPELYLRRARAKGIIKVKECGYSHDYD
jgi:hypothetical protein